jgi:hypothetical protein
MERFASFALGAFAAFVLVAVVYLAIRTNAFRRVPIGNSGTRR